MVTLDLSTNVDVGLQLTVFHLTGDFAWSHPPLMMNEDKTLLQKNDLHSLYEPELNGNSHLFPPITNLLMTT